MRENGRFEVYSDFMLVSEYHNPQLQCVDIETDFNQFFLKFVKNSHMVSKQTEKRHLQFEIRQVRHFWRNRISFSTSNVKRDGVETWNHVLHHRIAGFCRLYTQILNFSMHMLVSHRNMISVFDMSKGLQDTPQWIDTVSFADGNIRQIFLKKRSKRERNKRILKKFMNKDCSLKDVNKKDRLLSVFKKYKIVCFIGVNAIKICELNELGKIMREEQEDSRKNSVSSDSSNHSSDEAFYGVPRLVAPQTEEVQGHRKGRIISIQNDDQFNNGVLILHEETESDYREFQDVDGCQLYNFPFLEHRTKAVSSMLPMIKDSKEQPSCGEFGSQSRENALLTLYVLKHQRLFKLLTNEDSKCLAYDSFFNIMQSHGANFPIQSSMAQQKHEVAYESSDE